jgi:hypothetical protein
MDPTQVAALVFDPQKQELLDTLGIWDRGPPRNTSRNCSSPGRTDAGGLRSVTR